jgi:hypothetical protein
MEINNSFRKLAEDIKRKLQNEEKFFVSALATRMSKVANENPKDLTIVQMANFLTAKSENPQNIFITRKELTDAYKALWSTNTKCASYLKDEIIEEGYDFDEDIIERQLRIKKLLEDEAESNLSEDFENDVDQELVDALESAFNRDEDFPSVFNKEASKKAEILCQRVLPGKPTSIKAVDGSDFAIICQASYMTPRGTANVLIPLEVVDKQPLIPSIFLSQNGFESLSQANLEAHVKKVAGKSFRVDSKALLEQVKVAKFGPTKETLDEVDLAVLSLKSKVAATKVTPNGIKYEEIFAKTEEKQIVQPVNKEYFKAFASELSSVSGMAESVFGKSAVELGRTVIAKELKSANINSAQIKVSNFDEDKVTYSVAANGFGFKVPVTFKKASSGYLPTAPSVIVTNGGIESFDKDGIKNALAQNDYSIAAEVVGIGVGSPTELIDEVVKACDIRDFDRANIALAKLQDVGDSGYFKYAFEIYSDALMGQKKEASVKMKTVMINGNLVEATTGLPVDRVYINENGQVVAKHNKYAEKSEDNQQVAMITNKIWNAMS